MPDETPTIEDAWAGAKRERIARLSPEPLLRIVQDMACRDAAAFLGVNVGTLQKWRNDETSIGLHYARADRIAVRNLGKHPSAIWGADWWRA